MKEIKQFEMKNGYFKKVRKVKKHRYPKNMEKKL